MQYKDHLLELIESLTMSEKRFFKIFSKRHTIGDENQYLLLFDFIEKHRTTQKNDLQKQHFVKNVSAEKNYLYRLILKSLNSYYYEFSTKMKVQNAISNAEILAYKGMESQALKTLVKAKKMAEDCELYAHLTVIHQTQFEVYSKINNYELALKSLVALVGAQKNLSLLTNVQKQATDVYTLRLKTGGLRSNEDLDILNDTLSNISKHKNSFVKASLFSTSISIVEAHAKKEYQKEIKHLQRIISLYEENPFLIELSVKGYVNSIYNLANTYRNLKEHSNALNTLDKMNLLASNKLISASKSLSAHVFYLVNNIRLYILVLSNDYVAADKLLQTISSNYAEYEAFATKTVVYEHYMLRIKIEVELERFKDALKFTNLIINDSSYKERQDLASYIRLLNLVIHFELNNDFTLEYLSTSAQNFIKRKQRLFKTEKQVIRFIGKFNEGNIGYLTRIQNKLQELKKDPYENSMFIFFDFEKWVSDKLDKLS
jgi:tetratricopeptide (TPR) repeat protein